MLIDPTTATALVALVGASALASGIVLGRGVIRADAIAKIAEANDREAAAFSDGFNVGKREADEEAAMPATWRTSAAIGAAIDTLSEHAIVQGSLKASSDPNLRASIMEQPHDVGIYGRANLVALVQRIAAAWLGAKVPDVIARPIGGIDTSTFMDRPEMEALKNLPVMTLGAVASEAQARKAMDDAGLLIFADPALPNDTIEFRHPDGRQDRIVGLGKDWTFAGGTPIEHPADWPDAPLPSNQPGDDRSGHHLGIDFGRQPDLTGYRTTDGRTAGFGRAAAEAWDDLARKLAEQSAARKASK